MRKIMRTLIVAVVIAAFIIVPVAASPSMTPGGNGGGIYIPLISGGVTASNPSISAGGQPGSQPQFDDQTALVELKGDPLSTYAKTRPSPGKKIDFNSSAVKSYRAQLAALRNDFKAWLRLNAPNAKITGQFDISLNAVSVQLNGEALQTIASAPQVARAEYEGLYYPTADDPDLSIIQAMQAWDQGGGSATAGEGVKVAIIDTGIDVHHPCFDDTGYPSQKQSGDTRFTNNKVIVARVFNNKTPSQKYTPEAIQDHGTHVAGTVACNFDTAAEVNGVTIPYGVSGVAPRALLGNYNVFPGNVTNARSEDILNALEAAYADGMDIANMSLGGNAHGIQDLLTMAVNNLDEADMVVAVAAGNSGPGYGTVESPGSAARALTAGASTVPHFVGAPVTVGTSTYGAASGDFATTSSDLTAPLAVVAGSTNGLDTACSPVSVDLSGDIALISRGVCTFSAKIRNAQDAGAVAVLVANNVAGDPVAMASDGTPNQPTVPAYMVSLNDGQDLATHDTETATIGASLQYFLTSNVDIMAGFSGQGPTDVDFRVKPDVVAPGVNVLSSIPLSYCGQAATTCWAFFQGTSMATPHLAGSAAIVRQQHPDWSAAEIRSAIVNTADQGVLKDYKTGTQVVDDANIAGAGREDLLSAVEASVALDPVSVSFGAVPSGSGQTHNFDVSVTNLISTTTTYDLAIEPGDASVAYSLDQTSVTLDPGASASVTVQMAAQKGASPGFHQAWLTVSSDGNEVAHAAVLTDIK
jgi:minor extracellular serine protease Vpr